jgi:cell division protein FtsW
MARHASHILLAAVLLLVGLGMVMLISTGMWSEDSRVDAYFSVRRQFGWLAVSVVVGGLVARLPYRFWLKLAPWMYVLACVLLALCFTPLFGVVRNGSHRWINLRALGLSAAQWQPSEFAKLALIMALAAWYVRIGDGHRRFFAGFLVPCAIILVPLALVGAEVDLGAAVLIGLASFAVIFAAGGNFPALLATVAAGIGGIYSAIMFIPNRARRFIEFFDVLKNPMAHLQDTGMQQVRAQMAFASGGLEGVGLGNGQQKILGLPYAHTDFIFPMVGEELGMWATLSVVSLYVVILVSGLLISLHAPDRFGKLLGVGAVVLIALQASLNIAVTTVCLPNKGLPLPFVSSGGSNLLFCLTCVGLLLSLHRDAVYPEDRAVCAMPRGRLTPRA